jgi:hypothetical protein
MIDARVLVSTVFAGLSPLIVQDVVDEGGRIRLRVRTPDDPRCCPDCGTVTSRVHGYHQRIVADVSVDARPVVLWCGCVVWCALPRAVGRTFREQIPRLLRRYQRRTVRLATRTAGPGCGRFLPAQGRLLRHDHDRCRVSDPGQLPDTDREPAGQLSASRAQLTMLANSARDFATLLKPDPANAGPLDPSTPGPWITAVREADLPHPHSFRNGPDQDRAAVNAGLALSHHNDATEGVNTKTKLIKRQMYGRAGFTLLRHHIPLG